MAFELKPAAVSGIMQAMETHEKGQMPYETSPLRGDRLLVLAPHPDDEAIGCGGLIALHAREHRQITTVVFTNGDAAESAEASRPDYGDRRRKECIAGLEILGAPPPRFLGLGDRTLTSPRNDLPSRVKELLTEFKPDLILCPSPIELHPDHRALAESVWEVVQKDAEILLDLPTSRVAYYETSQPIRPDTLIDISTVADVKFQAIRTHQTQLEIRDYERFSRGLSRYRTLTLPPAVEFAEAYWVRSVSKLRTMGWDEITSSLSQGPVARLISETIPITVITRTKDRPDLLAEALDSIAANLYPARVIVVNDGGSSPEDILRSRQPGIDLIENETSRGRSEAMNQGVRAAETRYVAFLDDDDLFFPEHLGTLAGAMAEGEEPAVYTDAVSAFLEQTDGSKLVVRDKLRLFGQDFDRDLLLLDNYIPLPTLLVDRHLFLDVGGFDPEFDLFEDWDFLIRLSERGHFRRIPRITCEIRHIPGGGSVVIGSPEGSSGFRAAQRQVWDKHRALITDDVIANVQQRHKRTSNDLWRRLVEERGRAAHLESDIARLERDKNGLLEARAKEQHEATSSIYQLGGRLHEAEAQLAMAIGNLTTAGVEKANLESQIGALKAEMDILLPQLEEAGRIGSAMGSEIQRLNDLLNTIYRSKTWKLHVLLEKLRGR